MKKKHLKKTTNESGRKILKCNICGQEVGRNHDGFYICKCGISFK